MPSMSRAPQERENRTANRCFAPGSLPRHHLSWFGAWSAMPGWMPGNTAVRSTKPRVFPPGRLGRSDQVLSAGVGAWRQATYLGGVTYSSPLVRTRDGNHPSRRRGCVVGDRDPAGPVSWQGVTRQDRARDSRTRIRAAFLSGATVSYNAWPQPGESGSRLLPTRPPGVGSGPLTRRPERRVCRGTGTRPFAMDRVLAGPP